MAGAAVVAALTLYAIRDVLAPFILAAIVSYVLAPAVTRLGRGGVPRGLVVAAVYLLFLAVVVGGLSALVPRLVRQAQEFEVAAESVRRGLGEYARQLGEVSVAGMAVDVHGLYQRVQAETVAILGYLASRTTALLLGFLSSLAWVLLIVLISLYLLADAPAIREYSIRILPRSYRADVVAMVGEIDQAMRGYIRGQLFLGLVIGIVTWVVTMSLGLRHALLLAVVAGVLEVVPIAGPILAAIPAVLVAIFQSPAPFGLASWTYALVIGGAYVAIQQLENNLLVPHIVGRSVNLHPAVVLLGVIAGASLAGVMGVFLAVPTLTTLRIVGRYLSRWMSAPEPR